MAPSKPGPSKAVLKRVRQSRSLNAINEAEKARLELRSSSGRIFYHDDNTAMIQILKHGRNPTLRALGRTHFLSLVQSHEEIHKPYSSLGHIDGEGMCADIHTKEFPPSRLAYWNSARQNISVLSPEECDALIGLPGRGWLNWTENPGRYIRKQTHMDPWAQEGELRPGANAPVDGQGLAATAQSPMPSPTHRGATLPDFVWTDDEGNPIPLKVAGDCVGLGTSFEVARRLMPHQGIERHLDVGNRQ